MSSLRFRFLAVLFVACALVLLPHSASADNGDVRAAQILVKAMSFNVDLESHIGDSLTVAVVYKSGDHSSEANADSWIRAFGGLGDMKIKEVPIRAMKVPLDARQIDDAVSRYGVDALLASDGLENDLDAINNMAMARKLMTIGSRRSMVERGLVLGTFVEDDRPRIIINVTTAQRFGIQFSSSLLRVAVLVK